MKRISPIFFQSQTTGTRYIGLAKLAVLACMALLIPQKGYAVAMMETTVISAISSDGNSIVGSEVIDGEQHAFRRTEAGGMQDLGVLSKESEPVVAAISNDGTIVVGHEVSYPPLGEGSHQNAFRWNQADGMQYLSAPKSKTKLKDAAQSVEGRIDRATAISGDGKVVVGRIGTNENAHAFRWTMKDNTKDLGILSGGKTSAANAVSGDGSVIVGVSDIGHQRKHAFRWTKAGGMKDLGVLGKDDKKFTSAAFVSKDGSVVAGAGGDEHAFRWTKAGGMKDLGTLGGKHCDIAAMSDDGNVIVGASSESSGDVHAFRWAKTGGIKNLGVLEGKASEATGVSKDGSVVVGKSEVKDGFFHAFRWTKEEGMKDLGTLGGKDSISAAVSDDGSVVVGESRVNDGHVHIFRWTQKTGMVDLGAFSDTIKSHTN